jgi:hypothetical protein
VLQEIPFEFEVPVRFFKKADAGSGRMRRIGGIISTENPDREQEVILQRGLDFSDYIKSGWLNDNHSRATEGIVGYPEFVKQYQAGEALPDGSIASTNLTWSEGYLLNTKKADKIWELGQALQGTGRHLGYSVEGSIQKRLGHKKKTIAKARVRNVAITNCPVNNDSRLDILAKSLVAVEQAEEPVLKALGMGTTGGVLAHPAGPQVGAEAGQVLATESLETGDKLRRIEKPKDEEDEAKKSLTDVEAIAWVLEKRPGISLADAGRLVDITKTLKRRGRL